MCDGKHRPECFLFIHKTNFYNNKLTASQHPSFQMKFLALGYINADQGLKHNIECASTNT